VRSPDSNADPDVAEPHSAERAVRLLDDLHLRANDVEHFRLALTHRSVAHELRSAGDIEANPVSQSNERLEFLGDAVLGFVVARELYQRFPQATEGELTSRRVSLVRAEQLVTWARSINLGEYLHLATGERISDSNRDRILAGAFEALIGAITLDAGIDAVRAFILTFLERDIDNALAANIAANPKGQLQEYLQEHYREPPIYRIIGVEGPEHARTFTAEVLVDGQPIGSGIGESKRIAEQAAADQALDLLEGRSLAKPRSGIRKRRRPRPVKGKAQEHG